MEPASSQRLRQVLDPLSHDGDALGFFISRTWFWDEVGRLCFLNVRVSTWRLRRRPLCPQPTKAMPGTTATPNPCQPGMSFLPFPMPFGLKKPSSSPSRWLRFSDVVKISRGSVWPADIVQLHHKDQAVHTAHWGWGDGQRGPSPLPAALDQPYIHHRTDVHFGDGVP